MKYNIGDRLPIGKTVLFSIQMLLSIFVATVLIANVCGVDVSAGMVGAGLSTLCYVLITKGQSPMFLSNSGAFVSAIIFALSVGGYTGVAIGGVTACVVYCLFGAVFSKTPAEKIYKIFPPALIGTITAVIGLNLMGFIPGYLGEAGQLGLVIALVTMIMVAGIAHYTKGMVSLLPFLIGILISYVVCCVLTLTGVASLVDFSIFNGVKLVQLPNFAFLQWEAIDPTVIVSIIVMFIAYTITAQMEALADHSALSGVIGIDLFKKPGLSKIFYAEGVGNLVSTMFGGLGSCSYGESIGCIGFSKVASARVSICTALMLIVLAFVGPVQAFIASIPSCIFAGCAMILYGYIACSGVKMLQKVDLNRQKNLIIVSVCLSLGISGVVLGGTVFSLTTTALALCMGIILNVVLTEKN